MKCIVPEISWHNRDPVYTVDIQPKTGRNEEFYRLASGGTDSHVVIWYVVKNVDKGATVEFAADLQRHQRAINIVRFSPSGEFLASGDDEAVIIIWKQKNEQDIPDLFNMNHDCDKEKESWVSVKVLRGHMEDVYDLCWSPDGNNIVSGSIDNTAIVWDVSKARSTGILGEHKGFVQGVTWDPKNKYIATLGTDRTLRVFYVETKKIAARVSKIKNMNTDNTEKKIDKEDKGLKIFHDDTLKTFFRRLCFSPDGELLITPCGILEDQLLDGKPIDVSFIFTRDSLNRPVVHLPSPTQYSVAIRCCPVCFQLRPDVPSVFDLPYRVVFAVATKSNVLLYDTQQLQPLVFVSNIHYTGLTDLTWSPDGRILIISSTEGYCSIITFEENEIGTPCEQMTFTPTEDKTEKCKKVKKNKQQTEKINNSSVTNDEAKARNSADKEGAKTTEKSDSLMNGQEKIVFEPKSDDTDSSPNREKLQVDKRIFKTPVKIRRQNKQNESPEASNSEENSPSCGSSPCPLNEEEIVQTTTTKHPKKISMEVDELEENGPKTENCVLNETESKNQKTEDCVMDEIESKDQKLENRVIDETESKGQKTEDCVLVDETKENDRKVEDCVLTDETKDKGQESVVCETTEDVPLDNTTNSSAARVGRRVELITLK